MGYSQSKETAKEDEIAAGFITKHAEVENRVTTYSLLVITLVILAVLILGYIMLKSCNKRIKTWIIKQAGGLQGPGFRGLPSQQGHMQAAAGCV